MTSATSQSVPTGEGRKTNDLLVRTVGLSVGYGRRAILPPLDFEAHRRELWGVIGRNGAGKTTMFRTLLGLHAPVGGQIIRPASTVIGYVPQRYTIDPLVPARAVDLISEGAERGASFLRPVQSAMAKTRIERAIEATGTRPFLRRRYRDLSEGQKQRVVLARALAGGADLLVLDEPTSAMDLVSEQEVMEVLRKLRDELSLGILLVSHHLSVLVPVVDRLLFLDSDAGIAIQGTVSEVTAHRAFVERYGALVEPVSSDTRNENGRPKGDASS